MRTATELLVQYAAYHRDRRNIVSHFIGVPMIVFGVGVLLACASLPAFGGSLTLGWIAFALAAAWYLTRGNLALGITVSLAVGVLIKLGHDVSGGSVAIWLAWGVGFFFVGWVIQFIGHWYEGKKDDKKVTPPADLVTQVTKLHGKKELVNSGSILVGEKGFAYSPNDYGASFKLLPEESFKSYKNPEPSLPRNPIAEKNHDLAQKEEWLTAAKNGTQPMANFEYASYLTESMLLGNVAIRSEKKSIEYDGENMKIPNAPEAEQYLKREYRAGWTL